MKQHHKSSVFGCSRIISAIRQLLCLSQTKSEALKQLEYACCPPALLALLWPVFVSGRGHICKELCRRDLFISHPGLSDEDFSEDKVTRGVVNVSN